MKHRQLIARMTQTVWVLLRIYKKSTKNEQDKNQTERDKKESKEKIKLKE